MKALYIYESPKCETLYAESEGVLCQSGTLTDYTTEDFDL